MNEEHASVNRRHFLAAGAASAAGSLALGTGAREARAAEESGIVRPPEGKRLLLACKLGMIPDKEGAPEREDGPEIPLAERLKMAAAAGFDGVDFDQAGRYTAEEARQAVNETGVFVHNAINHAHWQKRLTSADEAERAEGRANIEHCIRVSHAAGGSGVLIVVGRADDGEPAVVEERCREEIRKLIPLAAALGQMILVENVWNRMFYVHDGPPDQSPEQFIRFVDSFQSPWVGMYYDIGNHWKYSQPREWLRAFGHRCVKLDIKGFSRAKDEFVDIGEGDLPWDQVRAGLADIGYAGWATAEVKGGDVERLTVIRKQMEKVFDL